MVKNFFIQLTLNSKRSYMFLSKLKSFPVDIFVYLLHQKAPRNMKEWGLKHFIRSRWSKNVQGKRFGFTNCKT